MYTSLEEAKAEVWKRWNDAALKKRVEDYLGGAIPEVFLHAPRAAIFRNIISPNLEYLRFRELAHEIGLEPLGLEYQDDRFCTRSTDKLMLANLRIFQGRDRNGAAITRCEKIIDVKASDNKVFRHIHTVWGESLVDFHRELTVEHIGKHEVHDLSDWILAQSTNALENYRKLFALFTCFGTLFDNFVYNDAASASFAAEVAYPAFADVSNTLGVPPQVVRIYSDVELEDISCWCWPATARDSIQNRRATVAKKQQLIELFGKHCAACGGICCTEYDDITFYLPELQRLPNGWEHLTLCRQSADAYGANSTDAVDLVISKRCPFLEKSKGCRLTQWQKPLDCFTFPIYPDIAYNGDSKELRGMMVYRKCYLAEEMARDNELMARMCEFWKNELDKAGTSELRHWFGYEKDFWQENNFIMVQVV